MKRRLKFHAAFDKRATMVALGALRPDLSFGPHCFDMFLLKLPCCLFVIERDCRRTANIPAKAKRRADLWQPADEIL